jgi:Transglutaminase-like superfamily
MRRTNGWCLGIWLWTGLVFGAEPAVPATEEVWEVVYSDNAKIGHVHTTSLPIDARDGKRLRVTSELELTFKRQNATVRLRMEQGSEETLEGKVTSVLMRQFPERGKSLELKGTVEDGKLHVVVDNGRIERHLRWSDDVVGLYRRDRLYKERQVKPGDRFSILTFEPMYNTVATQRVVVKDREDVTVLGARRSLLRVELTPEKIETKTAAVQLPGTVVWLDDELIPVRRQIELEGLGAVILTRTTRAIALAPPGAVRAPDIVLKTLIPLDRTIPRPHATRSAIYRVTLSGDADPATALVQDDHQEIRKIRDKTFELHVHPARFVEQGKKRAEPGPEFLASNYYVDSDDAGIQKLARQALGKETEAWAKAKNLERFVNRIMKIDNTAPMVPASQVAQARAGDCRHFALLTTALCRAAGLPARTALGLIYVEGRQKPPAMGFHMWTEVWVNGQWLGLDATLDRGGIGAAHIKISDNSWHEARSLTPLLPVSRVLGKLAIEVMSVEAGD